MKVKRKQSLFDVAVQYCGSSEAVFELAKLNELNITDMPPVGTELILPPVINQSVVDYYNRKGIKPATGGD